MTIPLKTPVAIVGAGPGGLSAALWCDDLGMDCLLFEAESEPGGQLLWTFNPITNHLGCEAETGRDASERFLSQIRNRGLEPLTRKRVKSVATDPLRLGIEGGAEIAANALIIASGIRRNVPAIANLEDFRGKGILESGKRDQGLAEGKTAVVVGGGDAAFENALILAGIAEKVYLVHRRDTFRARPGFVEAVVGNARIEILTHSEIAGLEGDERLESVTIKDVASDALRSIAAEALIFRIGVSPNSEFVADLVSRDARGYIETDAFCRTSSEGIFAVGDVANPVSPTVSTAAGMGATAAKAVFSWLYGGSDIQSPE